MSDSTQVHVDRIVQYTRGQIAGIWAAAALPMAALAWVVAPWIADRLEGPATLIRALLLRPRLVASHSVAHLARQDHGLELLEVLRISMPTPRGQEAQLDQVVEAHRIAREGRIDNASGKEEHYQDQFSSCVPTYLGLIR
jgi:hypothetical protein